jgi:hypothetical protein
MPWPEGRAQRIALLIGALGISCSDLPPTRPAPAAAGLCVYLTANAGEHYEMAYAHHSCNRRGYVPLPHDQFDAAKAWSFNAEHAGFPSPLDEYRIAARLATQDDRSAHGWSIHAGFWAEYQWAEHTQDAYLTALDALGRTRVVEEFLEYPLLRLRIADRDTLFYQLKQRRLSPGERTQLLSLLAEAEDSLAHEDRMRRVRRTLDAAVKAVPAYEDARRRNFSVFHLDP